MKGSRPIYVAAVLAVVAVLAPVKFGTPVIHDSIQLLPGGVWEWAIFSWPVALVVLLIGLTFGPVTSFPRSALALAVLVWIATQVLALPGAINWQTAADTVFYFTACVLVFAVAARHGEEPVVRHWVLAGLGLAMLVTMWAAFDQRFGGLEATRRFTDDEQLLKRLGSGRVFGTFVYPNTLAGFLVLGFGPGLAWLWTRPWPRQARWTAMALETAVVTWCLVLTGSRGGLVAFGVSLLTGAVLLAPTRRQRLIGAAVAGLLVVGGAAFIGHRGASSLEARLDYWGGAVRVIKDHPLLGTGPGTFGSIYPLYKTAATEEAELVHNAYLQMWSDSGVGAFLAFAAIWGLGLWRAVRRARETGGEPVTVALAAALVGWVVHQGVDFDLHVPGTGLPAFLLLGLAVAGRSEDKACRPWLRIGMVAAGLAMAGWEGRMLVARERLAAGDLAGAVRLAGRNPDYWVLLSRQAQSEQNWQLAIFAQENAMRLDPYRASRHWHLGLLKAQVSGWTPAAVGHVREAARLNPTKQRYREALAEVEEKLRHR